MVHIDDVNRRNIESDQSTTTPIQRPYDHWHDNLHSLHRLSYAQHDNDYIALYPKSWNAQELTYTSNGKLILSLYVAIVRYSFDQHSGIRRPCYRPVAPHNTESTLLDLFWVYFGHWYRALLRTFLGWPAHVHSLYDPILDPSHIPGHAFR